MGPRSIRLDYERLLDYLAENEKDLRETLRVGRYDMMVLARKYFVERDSFGANELEKLKTLVLD